MGRKLYEVVNRDKQVQGYSFYCPGCDEHHVFYIVPQHRGAPVWQFNGDVEKPTFRNSLLVNGDLSCLKVPRCHLWVSNGKIQFLNDCTHAYAGKTIEMEDLLI